MADPHLRKLVVVLTMAAGCMVGCSSDPEPQDLTAEGAKTLILQRWSREELNHFPVTFHSGELIECGIQNGLWNRVEISERGFTSNSYQLTENGHKALFAIELKESGTFHQIILRGPYLLEVTNITPGSQPDLLRQVEIHWEIDWDKAPAGLKACVPKFQMAGSQVALFRLYGLDWRFLSYLKPADVVAPPQPQPTSPFPGS